MRRNIRTDRRTRTEHPVTSTHHAQLLHAWFSPAMPTGAYTYSHGLEAAIAIDQVHDAHSLGDWIERVLLRGSGFNELCLIAAAWRAAHREDRDELDAVDALARALVPGRERLLESLVQGQAFARAAAVWVPDTDSRERMLPVTIGAMAAAAELPLAAVLSAAGQSFATNIVWIGARLIPVGQQQALGVVARLLPGIYATAERARVSSLAEIGSATPLADLASIRHESLPSRICSS